MPSKFTEDEQTRILLVLALNAGHSERAAAQLHDEGLQISSRQLRNLVHTDRYREVREQHAGQIEQALIGHYRDAARRSLELQIIATEQAIDQAHTYALDKPNPEMYEDDEEGRHAYTMDLLAWKQRGLKDPAKTAQNAAVASGVAMDKALVLDGKPNIIHGQPDFNQVVNQLAAKLGIEVTSTAEEIPDADQIDTSDTEGHEPALIPESADANARNPEVA